MAHGADTTPSRDRAEPARSIPPARDAAEVPVGDFDMAPLLDRVRQRHPKLAASPETYRFEMLLTCIDEDDGVPHVAQGRFRTDTEYVYPASAIKLFVTAAALAFVSKARRGVPGLDWDAPLARCTASGACTFVEDPSNRLPPHAGIATIGHLVRRVHLVSDNVAYNTLYDVVGHEELHRWAWDAGLASLRVHHRMFSWAPAEVQRTTPAFRIGTPPHVVAIPRRTSDLDLPPLPFASTAVGTAHVDPRTRRRVAAPMDFSTKNYASLEDHHRLILSLVRPDLRAASSLGLIDPGIDDDLRERLVAAMTEDPNASADPAYPPPHRGKTAFKPLLPGIVRVVPESEIAYANKAGRAYGFHVENAVIRYRARTAAVTVSVYGNEDGVVNDDRYDYDTVTRPVLATVGEAVAATCLASAAPAAAATRGP